MNVKRKIAMRVGAAAASVGAAGVLLAAGLAASASAASLGPTPGVFQLCNNTIPATFLPAAQDVIDVWQGSNFWGRAPLHECVTHQGNYTTGSDFITVSYFVENRGISLGERTFDLSKGLTVDFTGLI
jgi:hypothetical protein